MKRIYVADDGTQFDEEYKCEEYERSLLIKNLLALDSKIIILDEAFMPLNNWYEKTPDNFYGIYIENSATFSKFRQYVDDRCVMPWSDIEFVGLSEEWFIGRHFLFDDDGWICVEDEIQRNLCRNEEMMGYFDMEG